MTKGVKTGYSIIMMDLKGHYGVVSTRAFEEGEKIGDIRGAIKRRRYNHSLQIEPGKHIVDVDFAGYLMHSCEPNARADMRSMEVRALRQINQDEYLSIDYADTEDVLVQQFQCHCGSKVCRGWIYGRNESPYLSSAPDNSNQNHQTN